MLEQFPKTNVTLTRITGEDVYGDPAKEIISNFPIVISKKVQIGNDKFLITCYVENPNFFKDKDEITHDNKIYRINEITDYIYGDIKVFKGEFNG